MIENTIEPTDSAEVNRAKGAIPKSAKPAQKAAQSDFFAGPGPAGSNASQGSAAAQETTSESSSALVATRAKLKMQYLVDNDKYYFRDNNKTLAFEEMGLPFRRLVTHLDNAEVARSMVELAKAKGWASIKVDGNESFKRKVWVEAQLQGLSANGYKPDAFDQSTLQELRAIQASDARNAEPPESSLSSPAVSPAADAPNRDPEGSLLSTKLAKALHKALLQAEVTAESQEYANAMDYAADLAKSPRAYVGTLIEHGVAPYEFKEKAQSSYYIKLQTESGEKTVWGVDLPRAISERLGAAARPGDSVLLAFRGAQPVDVVDSETGQKVETMRNVWYFEKVSELAKVAASTAIRPNYSADASGAPQSPNEPPPSAREKVLINVLASKGAPDSLIRAVRAQVATSIVKVIPDPAMRPDLNTPAPRPAL